MAKETTTHDNAAEPLRDWRGQVLGVGDTVVYPGRRGSSIWINEGTVTEIIDQPGGRGPAIRVRTTGRSTAGGERTIRVVTLTALTSVTVVAEVA